MFAHFEFDLIIDFEFDIIDIKIKIGPKMVREKRSLHERRDGEKERQVPVISANSLMEIEGLELSSSFSTSPLETASAGAGSGVRKLVRISRIACVQ